MSLRKYKIVVEEIEAKKANGDQSFIIYLEGDLDYIKNTPDEKLSAAAFWALKLSHICVDAVKKAGALAGVTQLDKKNAH